MCWHPSAPPSRALPPSRSSLGQGLPRSTRVSCSLEERHLWSVIWNPRRAEGHSEAAHHTRWVLSQQMSGVEGLTLVPLDSGPKTLDAVLPLIGAPEQAPALGSSPRDFSRLSLGPKIGARDQWD